MEDFDVTKFLISIKTQNTFHHREKQELDFQLQPADFPASMRKPTAKMFIDSEAFYDVLDLRSVGRGIAEAKTKHQKANEGIFQDIVQEVNTGKRPFGKEGSLSEEVYN